MSHRAVVAIQTGPDSYDVHYSANGAYELQLAALLTDHLADGTTDLDGVADGAAQNIPQLERWNDLQNLDTHADGEVIARDADSPIIDPQPMVSGLSLEEVAMPVDFDNIEAFYLVRGGTVETYVPVWMEPNIIRPWRNHLQVEVYNAGKLSDDPRTLYAELDDADPVRVIDEETFESHNNWLEDTIVSDVVRRNHEYVYAMQRQMVDEGLEFGDRTDLEGYPDLPESYDAETLITTDSRYLLVRGPTDEAVTPQPTGRGLLIRVPDHNTTTYWRIVENANDARIETGTRLNMPTSITDEDRSEELKELVKTLLRDYHEDVAAFSPPPYGPLAESVGNALSSQ